MSEMKNTTLSLSADVLKNLKRIAVEKEIHKTELLREYIDLGIEKDKEYLKIRL